MKFYLFCVSYLIVTIIINYYNVSNLIPKNSLIETINDTDERKSYYFNYIDLQTVLDMDCHNINETTDYRILFRYERKEIPDHLRGMYKKGGKLIDLDAHDFLILKSISLFLLCPIFWFTLVRHADVVMIIVLFLIPKLFILICLLFNLDKCLTNNFIHELNAFCQFKNGDLFLEYINGIRVIHNIFLVLNILCLGEVIIVFFIFMIILYNVVYFPPLLFLNP